MILVDTNILSDILGDDPQWRSWSAEQLATLSAQTALVTNHVVIAELHMRPAFVPHIKVLCDDVGLSVRDLDWQSSAVAGAAFRTYRERGGIERRVLADLLIGGHALALGATLLTRDPKGFRSYFPDLSILAPETDHG